MIALGDCPHDKAPVKCLINPCDYRTCPNLPPTECVLNVCGECRAQYYWNNVDVTEFCSKRNCCYIILLCNYSKMLTVYK